PANSPRPATANARYPRDAALDVDDVAFPGHKLHAPYDTGALVVERADGPEAAQPYLAAGVAEVLTAGSVGPEGERGQAGRLLGVDVHRVDAGLRGPWRHQSTIAVRASGAPSKTASTVPSGRLRTQPFTPS